MVYCKNFWVVPEGHGCNGRRSVLYQRYPWVFHQLLWLVQLKKILIGVQIENDTVDGPKMSVDKVKETLRQEMVADLLVAMNKEMAVEIKAALMGIGREERGEIENARDDFQQDPMLSINIFILEAGDVDPWNDFKRDTIGVGRTEGLAASDQEVKYEWLGTRFWGPEDSSLYQYKRAVGDSGRNWWL